MNRQELINSGHLPNFEDIDKLYTDVEEDMYKVWELEGEVQANELDLTAKWQDLCAMPDFKPGRSNAERDIKMAQYHPDFMIKYTTDNKRLELFKNRLAISRLKLEQAKTKLRLASFVLEEDSE